jgi:hypothetical protein
LSQAAIILAAITAAPSAAFADFKVHQPDAETGEFEIEEVGSYGAGGNPDNNNEKSFVTELGYGVNSFWNTELEFETNRDAGPGNHLRLDQITSENTFQFTERGQYWIDSGFFIEYGQVLTKGAPNETTFGPIFRKEMFGTIDTVNLFIEKDLGKYASGTPVFSYAVESRLALGTPVEPGIQAYGTPGPIGHFGPVSQQDHRVGPMLFTEISNLGPGTLKANGGVLFGLTQAEPRVTLRWQLEYEVHF